MVQHAVCEIDYSLDSHSSSRFKIRKKMQQLEKPKKKKVGTKLYNGRNRKQEVATKNGN